MTRPHDHDSAACWCAPSLHIPCADCVPDQYVGERRASLLAMPTDAGCAHCRHGLVPVTRGQVRKWRGCVVLVHR